MNTRLVYKEKYQGYFLVPPSHEAKKLAKKHGFAKHASGRYWTTNPLPLFDLKDIADSETRKRIRKMERNFEMSWSNGENFEFELTHELPEGKKYDAYQLVAIAYALDKPFTIIADDQGTGKMIEGIGIINEFGPGEKYLIVCPSVGKYTWADELKAWSVYPWKINVCEGKGVTKEASMFDPDADINIMNYDLMMANKDAVMASNFKAIIFDEAHEIKNPKAGRSMTALGVFRKPGFVSRAKHVILTTGTPIENRPIEFYGILHKMAPHILHPFRTYVEFGRRFCKGWKRAFGWDMSGSSNERELNARLRSHVMIRRLKGDTEIDGVLRKGVQNDLPERQYQLIPIRIDFERQRSIFYRIDEKYDFDDMRKSIKGLKDMELGDQARYRREVALLKLPYTIRHIHAQLLETDKIVVFAHHRKVIARLMEEFKEYNPVQITGNTGSQNKRKYAKKFQEDPSCRLFFWHIK